MTINSPYRLLVVAGARPNFMKIAPIMKALLRRPEVSVRLVHTGQHYDPEMNDVFFEELGIPRPDVSLGVGGGSHAQLTGAVMQKIEPVFDDIAPHLLLVVGDVNSTIAAALVASKKGVAIAHVEAGLRSFDRAMPEEINRILTDRISDLLYTTEKAGAEHLKAEGIGGDGVAFVGNVMIDSLFQNLERGVPPDETFAVAGASASFGSHGFALLTLHRPSNVDEPAVLERLLKGVSAVADRLDVVFPVHPRTLGRIESAGLMPLLHKPSIVRTGPLGYLAILGLMRAAKLVMTDSGGIQEETTALGVPCLTLRENTERPITVDEGTNIVIGTDTARLVREVDKILAGEGKGGRVPALWDGKAADRIADHLVAWLQKNRRA